MFKIATSLRVNSSPSLMSSSNDLRRLGRDSLGLSPFNRKQMNFSSFKVIKRLKLEVRKATGLFAPSVSEYVLENGNVFGYAYTGAYSNTRIRVRIRIRGYGCVFGYADTGTSSSRYTFFKNYIEAFVDLLRLILRLSS